MRGQKLPADLVEKAAALYGENGNLAETARILSVPVSSLHGAFAKRKLARLRNAHAAALERGLRRARKSLDRLAERTDDYIHANLDTNSLEPRDLAALLKAQADLASTRAKIADREDRRRTGVLERQKLRAELKGELIQKHEVAAVAKVVVLPSLDDDSDAGSGVAPERGPADALSRDDG